MPGILAGRLSLENRLTLRIVPSIKVSRTLVFDLESHRERVSMRTRIGFFALMILTTWCGGKARSAGWQTRTWAGAGHSGFLSGKHNGTVPPQMYGSDDNIWCPKCSYFSYPPADAPRQTLTEYRDSWNPRVAGMNPDVFAISPLPYGAGRMKRKAEPVVSTTPAATAPADASAPTPPPAMMP